MEHPVNITEIIPAEISGYCDAETGECITTDTGAAHPPATENTAQTDDQIPARSQDPEERRTQYER
jgi:hypothetical protein